MTFVAVGDVIDNVSAMPEVYISGCATGNNRPRGFLLTSGKKMEVKGCFFENSRSAIHVSSDAGKWYESGNVYQLYIHDNHFKNCNYSTGTAAITICSPAQIDDVFVHHNIDIKNNLVELDRGDFVDLFGVEDVRIENNKIRVSSNKQQIPVNNVFVKVASCKDVKINNNTRV